MIAHQREPGSGKDNKYKHTLTSKDPRHKHPGVFVYVMRNMKETDIKINKNNEFMRQHSLTPEQRQRLIQDKLERARQIAQALLKREVVFQSR